MPLTLALFKPVLTTHVRLPHHLQQHVSSLVAPRLEPGSGEERLLLVCIRFNPRGSKLLALTVKPPGDPPRQPVT